MSWSTAFESMMSSTITVKTVTGLSTDGYGVETLSTGTSYLAHISGKSANVRSFQGTEEVASTVCWVKTTSTFSPSDQITIPSATTSQTPPLLRAEAFYDEDGLHHSKLFMG